MPDSWAAPLTRTHTFSTGRTATLRVSLPVSELVRNGLWTSEVSDGLAQILEDSLEDLSLAARVHDVLVMGMFVNPRIVPDDEVDAEAGKYPIAVLEESEIQETILAAFGGPAGDPSFPDDADDGAHDPGSGDVVDSAKPDAGPRGGKRRSSSSRRASGANSEPAT